MRKSMTGFGRSSLETDQGRFVLEMMSVNRKGLDFQLHLPAELLFLDPLLRKWCAQIAERGYITLRLSFEPRCHFALLEQLKKEQSKWQEIAQELKLSSQEITLPFLASQLSYYKADRLDEETIIQSISLLWNQASKAWLYMRQQEGTYLAEELQKRILRIKDHVALIENEIPLAKQQLEEKMRKYIDSVQVALDPQLVAKEVILHIMQSDITEEVTRLISHLDQFNFYLTSKLLSIGKTLDFLAQEMNREISTLMAKSTSSEMTRLGIEVKSEIEKIREQVQNIE